MYPNPTQDELFIKTNEASSVSIFTIEGRLIQNLDLTAGTTSISLTDYAAGTHLISLTNSKGKQTKKNYCKLRL